MLRLTPRAALPLMLLLTACGGTVVFGEDGGEGGGGGGGGGGGITTGTASTVGTTVTSGPGGPVVATSVGPGVTATATTSTGTGSGICGTGVSLFSGSQDACVGDGCCDLFTQCALGGEDPAGCEQCIDQGGGPRCADALRCVGETGCFAGIDECASGVTTGDPTTDLCLRESCCLEGLVCTQGGLDADGCLECIQFGGGPRCNGLLQCSERNGCFPQEGICASGLTTGNPGLDQCLESNCCDEFEVCTASGNEVEPCLDCFNQGGGDLCTPALECADQSCGGV